MDVKRVRFILTREADALGGNRTFRHHGSIRDFCENCITGSEDAIEIASRVIDYFCIDNDAFNGFGEGVILAVSVLNEICGTPKDASLSQIYRDLRTLLQSKWSADEFRKWATPYYG